MKKLGILIFIIAIAVGVLVANLFSFGRASGNLINFSFGNSIKGSGVVGSEVRNAVGFSGVEVGGVFQVEITVGTDFEVEVQADDNLLPHIKTEVDGGVLKIYSSEHIKSQNTIRVRVSAPEIENVNASGAAKVSVDGISGSSFNVDTSGASKLKLAGEVESLSIDVSGASNIDAENLNAKRANVDASGASKVNMFATEKLWLDASGASKISYAGNPTSVEKKTSGASSISAK